ncbi:hypothetical protein AMECASPLE_005009, partial [Ameca splendens]
LHLHQAALLLFQRFLTQTGDETALPSADENTDSGDGWLECCLQKIIIKSTAISGLHRGTDASTIAARRSWVRLSAWSLHVLPVHAWVLT